MKSRDPLRADIEAEEVPDLPVPTDIRAVFQGGLFLLALLQRASAGQAPYES
jgi:hypothetical protein